MDVVLYSFHTFHDEDSSRAALPWPATRKPAAIALKRRACLSVIACMRTGQPATLTNRRALQRPTSVVLRLACCLASLRQVRCNSEDSAA